MTAEAILREPIPVRVTRYACPSCGRTASSKSGARKHMGRCWHDPANRGCKTCVYFNPGDSHDPETGYPGSDEHCMQGVDLSGCPACARCGGGGELFMGGGVSECGDCAGDGAEVKPGPIVHCDLWQIRPEVSA
jgi:hypothetical protein